MTSKISKWGNSAAIRLPKEIMTHLSLHIGDNIEISEKDHAVIITLINKKKEKLIREANRIKEHALNEYNLLEGSLEDGLTNA